MDEEGTQRADSQNDTESAPLLVEEEESHSEPVMTSSDSTAGNYICCNYSLRFLGHYVCEEIPGFLA